jgi:nitrate reductase NapD
MSAEVHIAGIWIQARPEELRKVAESVSEMPGAKVHAVHAQGKVVVSLEAPDMLEIRASMDRMRGLAGVMTASLVYQHSEPLEVMNEEVRDETDAPGIH